MVEIKVCGLTRPADIELCLELGVNRLGFVLAPSSRRLDLQQLDRLIQSSSFFWSAVLVDPQPALVEELLDRGCPCLQFHGQESDQFLRAYAGRARIVKALRVSQPDHLKVDLAADEYLLDGARPGHGQPFEWAWLHQHRPPRPFYLAGGLNPDNVAQAIATVRPLGVDVSSGVEESAGQKCPRLLRRFVEAVRSV
ncbi:phosphoribosylanthranilate isomerase [bacterium]|nr:phosphoribosylanthranilate isomerase [bacterium]